MRIIILILLLISNLSCVTQKIKYDKNKLIEKYKENYTFFVDGKNIDLKNIFLDKNNISKTQLDNREKRINIFQFKKDNFLSIEEIKSLYKIKRKIALTVINGQLIEESRGKNIKIDKNIILNAVTITKEKINNNTTFCRLFKGDILIITTK